MANTQHSNQRARLDAMQLKVTEAAREDIDQLLQRLGTSRAGLTESEAEERLDQYGANEVAHERPPRWYIQLPLAFKNTFIILLIALAILSYVTGDIAATLIISIMVLISGLLRFFQEYRSTQAAEKLKAMVSTTATVSRINADDDHDDDSPNKLATAHHETIREVPIKLLVPGDIVHLAAGDMVPADVRLLGSKDLFISQAALTGESIPVEKHQPSSNNNDGQGYLEDAGASSGTQFDLRNICFMGTNVVSGTAAAVVVATSNHTALGSLARAIVGKRAMTSFDRGVNSVSWLLIRFMLVMVPLVFLINGLTKHNWTEAFFFALAVAVGLTPEMLPMIVTANLARGAVAMSCRKVIVKNLNAIQNMGAMDVLCTDKTGTLTRDKVILERHLDIYGDTDPEVLNYAYLNSFYQTGLKNLLDIAVLEHGELRHQLRLGQDFHKIDEIPFDFVRRRMSVVVEQRDKEHLLICKGAVEEMLDICARVRSKGEVVPLDDSLREESKSSARTLNEDGLRVLAVAYKEIPDPRFPYAVVDESEMVLAGFLAFLDPPKETAAEAISALAQHGVQIKVLTGDNEIVTRKICREVGLSVDQTVLGNTLAVMTDEELDETVEGTTVFAKLSPIDKSRVIKALKRTGRTVGFLGDGINDAPALREADVGISVDTAVDIAKESAEIILLEKNLLVLENGVIEGRQTFGNIIKYIKMGTSSNFGNMFSVLGASALLPFLPMLPLQLIVNNLLYDLSQTAIPFDSVDPDYVLKPRKWLINDIGRFMLCIGPISSIFDYTTYALMWWIFRATTEARQGLFQSGWFIESLLTQTLIIHVIRTGKIPFIQSRASLPLMLLTITIMAIGIYIPFSPLATYLGFVALPKVYFLWLVATLLSYCTLTQLIKVWYIRRFRHWL
jgi:Mg2+-importing ATPase